MERYKKQLELGADLEDMIKGHFKSEYPLNIPEGVISKLEKKVKKESSNPSNEIMDSKWRAKYLIASRFLGHGISELLKRKKGEEKLTEEELIKKRKSMLIMHKALIVKKLDKLKAEEKIEQIERERELLKKREREERFRKSNRKEKQGKPSKKIFS